MLFLQVFEELSQYLAWPRPAAILLCHGGKACLVDIYNDDVSVSLSDDDAIAYHHVKSGLTHVGRDMEKGCIDQDKQREDDRQVDIELVLPPCPNSQIQAGHG